MLRKVYILKTITPHSDTAPHTSTFNPGQGQLLLKSHQKNQEKTLKELRRQGYKGACVFCGEFSYWLDL